MTDRKSMEDIHGLGKRYEPKSPPPHNLSAEAAVIGAVLFDNLIADVVWEHVHPDDFYAPAHQWLAGKAKVMIAAGQTVDGVTLREAAESEPCLKEIGGAEYLFELLDAAAFGIELRDYAKIVRDLSIRRRLIRMADAFSAMSANPPDGMDTVELLAAGREMLEEAESHGLGQSSDWSNVDGENLIIDRPPSAPSEAIGLRTGIAELDKKLGPMRPGQLIILGGRPGMAKTGVARNIAENVARSGAVVAFAQLEMSREEMEVRSASSIARKNGAGEIAYESIIDGTATPAQRAVIAKARSLIPRSLWILSEGGLSVDRLAASLIGLRRARGRLDLVVVDYLQIMSWTRDRGQNDAAAIGAVTKALKQLAKKLQVPMIVLSQINRGVEARENKRPTLSDLRDSGAIEQDADVVIFVYREEYYLKAQEPVGGSSSDWDEWLNEMSMCKGKIELILAKKRMGRIGTAHLHYEETTDTLVSSKAELMKEETV